MLAYFVRRLVGAALTWLLTSFLLYSLIVPSNMPGRLWICDDCYLDLWAAQYEFMYALEHPWPLSYLVWLYEPNGTVTSEYAVLGHWAMNGDYVPTHAHRFERSGVVGKGFEDLLDLFMRLLLPGIALAILQGIGHRPHSHVPYRPTIPMRTYLLTIPNTRAL